MFGLSWAEIGVLVAFVLIIVIFVANMSTEKDTDKSDNEDGKN